MSHFKYVIKALVIENVASMPRYEREERRGGKTKKGNGKEMTWELGEQRKWNKKREDEEMKKEQERRQDYIMREDKKEEEREGWGEERKESRIGEEI